MRLIRAWIESIMGEEARKGRIKGVREASPPEPIPAHFHQSKSAPSKHRIKVVGVGGCGCNSIHRFTQRGFMGVELISMNTDAQHLHSCYGGRKLLLGRILCAGRGTRGNVIQGGRAALESELLIKEALGRPEVVFVICGLGGGTGSGAAPVVARIANDLGAMTIAMCTTPFVNEGLKCRANARRGLRRLEGVADAVLVVPNDRLVESLPRISLSAAFGVADEVFVRAIRGMTEGYAMTDDEAH